MRTTADFTWAELLLILLMLMLAVAILLPGIQHTGRDARWSSCANNLKQLGIVFRMYTDESVGGFYPPLSPALTSNPHTLGVASLYPEYLTETLILQCPTLGEGRDAYENAVENIKNCDPLGQWPELDLSKEKDRNQALEPYAEASTTYAYFRWATATDQDCEAMTEAVDAYRKRQCGDSATCDLEVDLNLAESSVEIVDCVDFLSLSSRPKLMRIKAGVENLLAQEPAKAAILSRGIPLLCDNLDAMVPGQPETAPHDGKYRWYEMHKYGANVLYLDGHAKFIRYPGAYPITENSVRRKLAGGTGSHTAREEAAPL